MSESADFELPPFVAPAPPADGVPGLVFQPDHRGESESLLLHQHDEAYKLHAFVRALVGPAQELEERAFEVLNAFDVDEAEGKTLDLIGGVVGVYRDQRSDTAFRAYIKARILTNTSECNAKTIYAVARALLGEDLLTLELVPQYPAHYDLEVEAATLQFPWDDDAEEPPAAVARSLADNLLLATSAGVSLTLFYQFHDDDHVFTFADADVEQDSDDQGFAGDSGDEDPIGGYLIGVEDRY